MDYRNHLFLQAKNAGGCRTLTGQVLIVAIFVDDGESSWDASDKESQTRTIVKAAENLAEDAKKYGVSLGFKISPTAAKVSFPCGKDETDSWITPVLKAAGLPATNDLNIQLKNVAHTTNAPVLFFFNKLARSYAHHKHVPNGFEYAVLYRGEGEASIRHELLHIFGAKDLYFPKTVWEAAGRYLPQSIMLTLGGQPQVDQLTAYLVGWTAELPRAAAAFLDATDHLTETMMTQAYLENTVTGTGMQEAADYYDIGELDDGINHGKGTRVWKSGTVYSGNWQHSYRDGHGTMLYKNGAIYTGGWESDQCNGKGTLLYHDGSIYIGDWKDGMQHGHGFFRWADGTTYEGDFRNDKKHGHGTITWPSGNRYHGQFRNDCGEGQGTFTWVDGTVYVGTFANYRPHGEGKQTFPDGTVQIGTWKDGVYIG